MFLSCFVKASGWQECVFCNYERLHSSWRCCRATSLSPPRSGIMQCLLSKVNIVRALEIAINELGLCSTWPSGENMLGGNVLSTLEWPAVPAGAELPDLGE